jgi:hypothetical protein
MFYRGTFVIFSVFLFNYCQPFSACIFYLGKVFCGQGVWAGITSRWDLFPDIDGVVSWLSLFFSLFFFW